ncbi:MAG: Fe-S cluster assembly protein SufD [Terrimicrobiaceae bacterium]|nr:Fe-S cluster assembly protein SufD [Terrimicrobiaceae bacterium]
MITAPESPAVIETNPFPHWFQREQAAALADYESTPAPTRRDEAWRFASLKALDLSAFVPAPEIASEGKLINASTGLGDFAARFVFGNNALVHHEAPALPEGVIVEPLDVAAYEHEALFRAYFMAQPVELGSHKYARLHKAMLTGGVLVHVPKNVEVALPIELFYWVEGENSSVFPHTLIVLGDNAKVTVIDHFKSADGARAFACGINDFHLGRGSQLTYAAVQDWSRDTLAFHLNSTLVGRDATATALLANFGGGYVRGESLSKLAHDGGRSVMLSMNLADGTREIDQHTLQDHAAKHASSDLLYQNVVDDAARTIFAGIIRVQEGESQTDAYQRVRNLLLTDDAIAVSMPGLEILNDDVRCTHGATSGGLDPDELFYMQARGISKKLAARLIVAGRFNSLVERIDNEALRDRLRAVIADRLGV